MIKTLLAGALLSTGLVAGGAVGADDAKMDNLKSNKDSSNQVITQNADGTTSFSQNFDAPKDAVPATPKGDAKTVERTEGTDSQSGFEIGAPEKPEHAKTVERTEDTDFQPGFEIG
ncbi:hypothetical protein II5_06152, partial [Bacillus cereus MSX-A1]